MLRHMPSVLRSSGAGRHADYSNAGHQLVPIPIARDPIGGWLIPRCSSPITAEPHAEFSQNMARPMVTDAGIIVERKKLNTSSGPNKSCLIPLRVRLVPCVVWFAVAEGVTSGWTRNSDGERRRRFRSPRNALRDRLRKVKEIGNKRGHGWGVIDRWDVEEVDEDYSWFAPGEDRNPVLMRPLPECVELPAGLTGARKSFDRPCGPYHDKSHACKVVQPC